MSRGKFRQSSGDQSAFCLEAEPSGRLSTASNILEAEAEALMAEEMRRHHMESREGSRRRRSVLSNNGNNNGGVNSNALSLSRPGSTAGSFTSYAAAARGGDDGARAAGSSRTTSTHASHARRSFVVRTPCRPC